MTTALRDTDYATEIATATLAFPSEETKEENEEARIERLFIKQNGKDGIRFSWWRQGRMLPRPLDIDEDSLLELLQTAIDNNVFTARFVIRLRNML